MLVHYKKNKKPACYDSESIITTGRIPPDELPHGPFKSCGNCLRTDMQRIHNRNNQKKEELT